MTETYEQHKKKAAERRRAASTQGREIGAIPPIVDPARRRAATRNLRLFCETYFQAKFDLAWSPDHLTILKKTDQVIKHGGRFAEAMPRGTGKTTICETAVTFGICGGYHRFIFLIGATKELATDSLDNLKLEYETNDLLLADFPEIFYPIRCLEGESRRASGQLHHGQSTHIGWGADRVVFPMIPGSGASGSIIRVAGITGAIRGASYTLTDGTKIRPTLALLDDLQTDESAKSPTQCATRLSLINGAVAGLAGPGRKMAMMLPCTVVAKEDVADQLLDQQRNPLWQGERCKMVYRFPDNLKLWDEYDKLRGDSFRSGGKGEAATDFYAEHRKAMDKGAKVGWEENYDRTDEISALQSAMNIKYADEAAFFAEYQNDPMADGRDEEEMTATQIAAKISGIARRKIPGGCDLLTAFIDVQGKALYYIVIAWDSSTFTGYIVDYGTYPDQKRRYFGLRDVQRTLKRAAPGAGLEGAIYKGLEKLTDKLLRQEWARDDRAMVRIDRCLIDANWGESTDVVYQFCRQSQYAAQLLPSHGKFVGATTLPFSDYKRKRGERLGYYWRIPSVAGKRAVRHVVYDTNWWKSFLFARWAVAMGDPGCLSLFGKDPGIHEMLADQMTAEYPVRVEGRGRIVYEWKQRPTHPDNHFLDCAVGAAVAASIQGAILLGSGRKRGTSKHTKRRKRVAYMGD